MNKVEYRISSDLNGNLRREWPSLYGELEKILGEPVQVGIKSPSTISNKSYGWQLHVIENEIVNLEYSSDYFGNWVKGHLEFPNVGHTRTEVIRLSLINPENGFSEKIEKVLGQYGDLGFAVYKNRKPFSEVAKKRESDMKGAIQIFPKPHSSIFRDY